MFALIGRAASRTPDVAAVVSDLGSMTYREMEHRARRVAVGLRGTGYARVGVVEADAARALVLLAAGSLSGVEICLYPPVASTSEVNELAERLDHELIVTDRDDIEQPSVRYEELCAAQNKNMAAVGQQPVLILTTGTTGVPRGVRHDWRRLLERALRARPASDERWLLAYGVHQFAGFQIMIHVASVAATLVDPGLRRPREGLIAMRRYEVTHASATPTFWRFLLAEIRSNGDGVPALRQISLGGEAVPTAVLDDIRAVFPEARVSQIYAASEFGPTGTVSDGRNGLPADVLTRGDEADVALKIIDGELWVRSRVGMLGYYGGDPIAEPDGWRPTGDLVEMVGDRIQFKGRSAEIINVGGVKVHPLPIEERISRVPGVAVVRVYGRKSSLTGSIVAAEVVPTEGADPEQTRTAILDECAHLPAASRPRSIRFVDEVVSHGNKILRRTDG